MNSFGTYVTKRIISSIFSIFLITIVVFLIVHLLPGDPVRSMLGADADQAAVDATRKMLNLDKPLITQYISWLKGVLHGDFGRSLVMNVDIADLLKSRIPISLAITLPAFVIASIIGILIGIACAIHRGSALDQTLTVFITTLSGIPDFWIGILMMFLFGVNLKLLPTMGYTSPFVNFGDYLSHAILPIMVLSLVSIADSARQMRTNMLDVLNQDYIRTAKANGLSIISIRYKHALKNTLVPIITLMVLQVRSLIGGSLLIEQIFSIPGMGRLIFTSVQSNDYLVIQALVLVISVIVIFCNLLLDISYGLIDPRIRATRKEV